MGDTRSRRANPGRASARRSGAGGAGISACPTQSMATQGKPLHLCRAVTPALAGVGLWHNAHRPHGSGSLSVQTPVWIGAQGTARPICPYVSRADGGNMGRDRIAWRVLLGRGEGRRRGGAGGAVVLLLVCWLVCELRDGSGAGWQGGRSAAGLARRFLLSPALPMRKSSLCRVLLCHAQHARRWASQVMRGRRDACGDLRTKL